MKILLVGAELFHVDRRTDVMNVISDFRNFANTPKTGSSLALNRPESLKWFKFTFVKWVEIWVFTSHGIQLDITVELVSDVRNVTPLN